MENHRILKNTKKQNKVIIENNKLNYENRNSTLEW